MNSSSQEYNTLHKWVSYHKVKPLSCEDCGVKARLEWANISGKYKRNLSDFKALCHACHRDFDGYKIGHCNKGHKFTPENIYYRPNGIRTCKTCKIATRKRYYHKHKEEKICSKN